MQLSLHSSVARAARAVLAGFEWPSPNTMPTLPDAIEPFKYRRGKAFRDVREALHSLQIRGALEPAGVQKIFLECDTGSIRCDHSFSKEGSVCIDCDRVSQDVANQGAV